jgi:hypothetical protein
VLWLIDGGTAREIARLPRLLVGGDPRPPLRLAKHAGGRDIGVVADGQPTLDGEPVRLWVFPVDVETGVVGEPEPLGAADFGDRSVTLCSGDDGGWALELPYPGRVDVSLGAESKTLQSPFVRMRLSRDTACVDRLSASLDPWGEARTTESLVMQPGAGARRATPTGVRRTIGASIVSARLRYAFDCSLPQP